MFNKTTLIKHLVIFPLVLYIVQARSITMAEREEIYMDCYQKTGMDSTVVAQAIKEASLLDPTPTYLAQLTCIYKGQGYQNDDGEIVPSEIKLFMKNFYTLKQCDFIVDNCKNEGGRGHGEIAYRAFACMLQKLKKIDEERESENNV